MSQGLSLVTCVFVTVDRVDCLVQGMTRSLPYAAPELRQMSCGHPFLGSSVNTLKSPSWLFSCGSCDQVGGIWTVNHNNPLGPGACLLSSTAGTPTEALAKDGTGTQDARGVVP